MNRRRSAAVAVLASLVLAGCGVGMPESGPIVQTTASGGTREDPSVNINPRHPGKGDSPEEIVSGFLDAMQATPAVKTSVAREFLTRQARAEWQPDGMVVYTSETTLRGNDEVEEQLNDASRTSASGAWLGPLPENPATVPFPMEQENGEWRISVPPPWLMVPKSWFEQRFRQVSLYFFDPSGKLLVPEPVFVPRGLQFASSLVNGLLRGPSVELATAEQTFLPRGLRSVSVPVDDDGVAHVDLTSDSGALSPPQPSAADLMVSQLAWTLRQDLDIERFQVTIDGRAVQLSNGESVFSVDHGRDYAPYVASASDTLYGLREGRMVAGSPESLDQVSGAFGQQDLGLRSVVPDLEGDRVAGASTDGSHLWLASVNDADVGATALISDGQDLLDPAWDFRGRLWVVDRTGGGAVVQYVRGTSVHTLTVDGISGANIIDFLVSRDGSRLVAVRRDEAGNETIVVSRILSSGDGRLVQALAARDITDPEDLGNRIRSIAWRSPTNVTVLYQTRKRLFLVRSASLDGAPVTLDALSITIGDEVRDLVGSPAPQESSYALVPGGLIDLSAPSAAPVPLDSRVTSLGYAG